MILVKSKAFGYSASISDNGKIIAIGAPEEDANGYMTGKVYTYYKSGNSWIQLVEDGIKGGSAGDYDASKGIGSAFGHSVSLSEEANYYGSKSS